MASELLPDVVVMDAAMQARLRRILGFLIQKKESLLLKLFREGHPTSNRDSGSGRDPL